MNWLYEKLRILGWILVVIVVLLVVSIIVAKRAPHLKQRLDRIIDLKPEVVQIVLYDDAGKPIKEWEGQYDIDIEEYVITLTLEDGKRVTVVGPATIERKPAPRVPGEWNSLIDNPILSFLKGR